MHSVFNFLIETPTTLVSELITDSGIKMFIAPEYNLEQNVATKGIIKVLPKGVETELKVGDEVFFDYRVVAATATPLYSDFFAPIIDSPYHQEYKNGKGDLLKIVAVPGKISVLWIGLLTDKYGERIDGKTGNGSEIDRWKAQFNFSAPQNLKFKNLVTVGDKCYWKVKPEYIYAKLYKNHIQAIGDRIICCPIEDDVKQKIELINGEILPFQDLKVRYYDRGRVFAGGNKIGLKPNDIISFSPNFVEKYTIKDKQYFLIKENRVNGIFV